MRMVPRTVSKMLAISDDQQFVIGCTGCLRTLLAKGYKHLLHHSKKSVIGEILLLATRLLEPASPELLSVNVGYILIHVLERLDPRVSTELLMAVVKKLYRSRMPSVVQSLVALFARLLLKNPKDILALLTSTSVDSRISLKILLDRWLLHQPLFRGKYSKAVTCAALLQLFTMRDPQVETLMVITYNPSHSNVNSGKRFGLKRIEVNAPFKILCTLIRCVDNEAAAKVTQAREVLEAAQELLKPIAGMLGAMSPGGASPNHGLGAIAVLFMRLERRIRSRWTTWRTTAMWMPIWTLE